MEYEKIIDQLKELRKSKKISREELADAIDVTKMTIYYIENKKTDLKLKDFLKICEVLDISPRELLDSKTPREFYNTTAEQLENLSNRDFLLVKNLIDLMENPIEAL